MWCKYQNDRRIRPPLAPPTQEGKKDLPPGNQRGDFILHLCIIASLHFDDQTFVYLMASIVRSSLCSVSPTNSWTASVIALINVSGEAPC